MVPADNLLIRRRYDLRGQVQGVGFRPFVCRIAQAADLSGFVANDNRGVVTEAEGPSAKLEAFERAMELDPDFLVPVVYSLLTDFKLRLGLREDYAVAMEPDEAA